MGIEVIIAAVSLAFSAYSANEQQEAQKDARRDQKRADAEQRKARQEQAAGQAAQSAAERRQQIREERIKRARLIQSGENTGTGASSGVAGAAGNLSTQLNSNVGFNIGQERTAGAISAAGQNAADFLSSANSHVVDANQWGNASNVGMSIFQKAGGFNIFDNAGGGTQAPAPVADAVIKPVTR